MTNVHTEYQNVCVFAIMIWLNNKLWTKSGHYFLVCTISNTLPIAKLRHSKNNQFLYTKAHNWFAKKNESSRRSYRKVGQEQEVGRAVSVLLSNSYS